MTHRSSEYRGPRLRTVPDFLGSQIEEDGTTSENYGVDYISDDKDPAMQDDQTSKHPKMTIIILPLMTMMLTTQYSLVTQSPNHFSQEVSEYPLQS